MKRWIELSITSIPLLWIGCGTSNAPRQATQATPEAISAKQSADRAVLHRQQVIDAQNRVTLAEATETTAKAALEEARKFRDTAEKELQAQGINNKVQAGAEHDKAAFEQARAKLEYADYLIALKEAGLEQARADIEMSRSHLDLTKTRIAVRNGQTQESFLTDAEKRYKDAETRSKRAQYTTKGLEREASDLKYQWERRQQMAKGGVPVTGPAATGPAKRKTSAERAMRNPSPAEPESMPAMESKEPSPVVGGEVGR